MSDVQYSSRPILIVDDTPEDIKVIGTILRQKGFRITFANSGGKALEIIKQNPPDLILLDIKMPDMDGFEVCRRLKANETTQDIPIIFLSVGTETDNKLKGLELGAVDYITKPFEPVEVAIRVEKQLTIRNLQRQLEEKNAQLEQEIVEHKQTEKVLRESEEKYRSLFDNSLNGFALHQIVTNDEGQPIDYIFLEANRAFEELTGLRAGDILGKRVTEILSGIEKDPFIEIYGRVALTGDPVRFEQFATSLNKYYDIAAFSSRKGQFAVIFTDITERVRAEEQIKAALVEKEALLKEVYHRVKNNLGALNYLIEIQAGAIESPEAHDALEELQGRVRAMGLVHQKLYQAQDLAQIDFGEYLEDITDDLFYALGGDRPISLRVEAEEIFIEAGLAIPCGLMVNELVTNALKYAFPSPPLTPPKGGRMSNGQPLATSPSLGGIEGGQASPEIRITFGSRDGEYVLTVSDNGVGLPPELNWRTTESLGLRLVNIWATHQLGGSLEVDGRDGTAFTIKFSERR